MEHFFTILSDNETKNCLCLPSIYEEKPGIQGRKQLLLTFGNRSLPVKLEVDAMLNQDTLRISKEILEQLDLPYFPKYKICWREPELILGPYIGMLVSITHSFLEEQIHLLSSFINNYEQLGGAILAFSLEGVNPVEKQIHGFVYNPHAKHWEKGSYAYPASLFSNLEVSTSEQWDHLNKVMKHFHEVLGNRVFNFPTFNQWEMYQWLKQYPQIQGYLPDTLLYCEPKEIHQMLKKHQKVYIRPLHDHLGLEVVKAKKVKNGIAVRYESKGRTQKCLLRSPKEFIAFFQGHLIPHEYLIEEAIDLAAIEGKTVDFRLVLIRDGDGEWANLGTFGRYGEKKSMVRTGEYVESGKQALKKVLALGHEGAVSWNRWMTYLSIQAAKAMEEYGSHCGNLSLDLALDKRKRLWLLDINSENPNAHISMTAGKEEEFLQIRHMIMLYCKRLAGF